MKKLVDETTDDFTRSLLIAGIEHRPPAANRAHLLVALGAGSAVGLFSAKAFGWLGTGAGKVTLVGMALGVAGAAYSVAPLLSAERDGARDGAVVVVDERAEPSEAKAVVAPLMPLPAVPDSSSSSAASSGLLSEEREAASATTLAGTALDADEAVEVAASAAKPKGSRRKARAARVEQGSGPLPAVEKTPPAVGALAETAGAQEAEKTRERLRLDSEVALVDDMHWAARSNDHEALARFVESYRLQFPDGQLQAEVAKFAARLERSSAR